MRITEIRAETLSIGPTLVRIDTDDGIVGLSEIGWHDPRIFRGHLDRVIRPQLIGADPLQPGRIRERLVHGTRELPYPTSSAFAGVIDIALWDIVGKHAGLPISTPARRGGPDRHRAVLERRRRVREDAGPDGRRRRSAGRDQGFVAFKIRMDWGPVQPDVDPAKDIEMARRCREALGPGRLDRVRCQPRATRSGRRSAWAGELETLGYAHFEEPLPEHDLAGLREVCRALDIPVSTGEQLKNRWEFRDLIAGADPDILQPDIVDAGGISEVLRIAQLAEVHGKPVMPHSPAAGILSTASLHVYATLAGGFAPHEYSEEYGPPPDQIAELFVEPVQPQVRPDPAARPARSGPGARRGGRGASTGSRRSTV